jgi:hypothetical protein
MSRKKWEKLENLRGEKLTDGHETSRRVEMGQNHPHAGNDIG